MTRKTLALSLLRDAGERGVETAEFLNAGVGSRYGARLLELRNEGHVIEAERIRNGSWRYTLVDVGGVRAGSPLSPNRRQPLEWRSPGKAPNGENGEGVRDAADVSEESEAGVNAGPSCHSLGASVDPGRALVTGATNSPDGGAARLFDPPSRHDRLREMDGA